MQSARDETAGVLAAGWYPEAGMPTRARWWDGERWTAHILDNGDPGIAWVPALVESLPPIVSMVDGELVIDLTGVGELRGTPIEADAPSTHEDPTETIVVLYGGAPGAPAPSRYVAPEPRSFAPVVRLKPVVREQVSTPSAHEVVEILRKPRRPRRRLVAAAAAALLLIGAVIASAVAIGTDSASSDNQPGAVFQVPTN